jgi:S1-C subfamily serine protease
MGGNGPIGLFFATLSLAFALTAAAQAPDAPIESAWALWEDDQVMDRVEALYARGDSLDVAEARKALRAPVPGAPVPAKIEPVPLRTQELMGGDVARLARKSFLRLGWFGGESEDDLGLFLGAAFAIDKDIFVTCRHVVAPGEINVGCLAAIDLSGKVYPVQAIVAADRVADVAVVRIVGTPCEPLPLSTDASPGDRVYCFSEPLDAYGYFDEGIVNRFFRLPPPEGRHVPEDAPALVRMHVSVDWAPGSSGAATLDRYGNAIGIVSAVQTLSEDEPFIPFVEPKPLPNQEGGAKPPAPEKPAGRKQGGANATQPSQPPPVALPGNQLAPRPKRRPKAPTLMVLHEATPAKAALHLIEKTNAAAEEKAEAGE